MPKGLYLFRLFTFSLFKKWDDAEENFQNPPVNSSRIVDVSVSLG